MTVYCHLTGHNVECRDAYQKWYNECQGCSRVRRALKFGNRDRVLAAVRESREDDEKRMRILDRWLKNTENDFK